MVFRVWANSSRLVWSGQLCDTGLHECGRDDEGTPLEELALLIVHLEYDELDLGVLDGGMTCCSRTLSTVSSLLV